MSDCTPFADDELSETAQERANHEAYNAGVRHRREGRGFDRSGRCDFHGWRRSFERGFKKEFPWIDEEASYQAWMEGWSDEDDQQAASKGGQGR